MLNITLYLPLEYLFVILSIIIIIKKEWNWTRYINILNLLFFLYIIIWYITEYNTIFEIGLVTLILFILLFNPYSKWIHIYYLFGFISIIILILSTHFGFFYLTIEILSLTFYLITAYQSQKQTSIIAAIQYLFIGAISSGFLLLGIAFIYYQTGTTNIQIIQLIIYIINLDICNIGYFFLLLGLILKFGAVPFHFWVLPVYVNSPSISLIYLITIPKFTLVYVLNYLILPSTSLFFILFAFLSLLLGITTAINQSNWKRLLTFSSISHSGYLLLLLLINKNSIIFSYTYIYLSTLLILLLLLLTYNNLTCLSQFIGFFYTQPLLSFTCLIFFFSFISFPPFIGFFTKYFLLLELINNQYYFLSLLILFFSVYGAFYILRWFQFQFFHVHEYSKYKTILDIIKNPVNYTRKLSILISIIIIMQLLFVLL